MWWVEHVHEVLNVVQGLGHGFAGAPVLVEVNVQGALATSNKRRTSGSPVSLRRRSTARNNSR